MAQPQRKTGIIALAGAAILLVLIVVVIAMQITPQDEIPAPNVAEAVTPVTPDQQVSPDVTMPPAYAPPDPRQPAQTE
jgi:hypothetical protein